MRIAKYLLSKKPLQPAKGFTLIELVVVITIIGILAASALPQFINIGQQARITAIKSLASVLVQASANAHAKCLIATDTCHTSKAYNASPAPVVIDDGKTYLFHYGYPVTFTNAGRGAIYDLVDFDGFTKQPYVNGSHIASFTKDGAPNTDQCKVNISTSYLGRIPPVTTYTSGC